MDKKVKFTLRLTEEDLEIIESIKGDIGEVTTASAIRYIIRNYASLQTRFHRLIRQGKEKESKFKSVKTTSLPIAPATRKNAA